MEQQTQFLHPIKYKTNNNQKIRPSNKKKSHKITKPNNTATIIDFGPVIEQSYTYLFFILLFQKIN
jgi:hypothetical protein